jgi:hypothetical protein
MSKRMDNGFPVVKIPKSDVDISNFETLADLMDHYRRLTTFGGIVEYKPHKIGIRTWFDEEFIYLQNFKIDPIVTASLKNK